MRLRPEQRRGVHYSAILHGVVILITIFGLPLLFNIDHEPEPQAFTVEILPLSEISNIKPSQRTPTPKPKEQEKPKEQKKEEPKPEEKPKEKPVPKVKTEEAVPEEPKPEPVPEKKKEEPKKEEKKKEEKKKKEKEPEDIDAILKAVKKELAEAMNDSKEKAKDQSSDTTSKSERYDASMPLSISEKDAIKNHFTKFWSPDLGAKDAASMVVTVVAKFNADGTVIDVQPDTATRLRAATDMTYDSFMRAALRAVQMGSPIPNTIARPDKYGGANGWNEIEITFDPRNLM